MKILRVTTSMNPAFGGPPHGIRASIRALAKMGVENEVVCCDAPGADWNGQDAFPIHLLGPGRFGFSFAPELSTWLRKNTSRFDAVVVHGMWQWPGLAVLRSSASKYFLMPHGMLDPWFQRDATRRLKAVRNWLYWWLLERRVVNGAAGVLFTCLEELQLARTTFGGYRPKRELNVGYGIEAPPRFSEKMQASFLEKLPRLESKPYLLFLGRIHPKKGVEMLVRAYSEILKTEKLKAGFPELVIAGPGWDSEYGRQIRGRIDGVAGIHAVGMLEGDAKWGAMHGCDAFVLPSHQENFGIAVAEALACNKPVLISDKVNIWREISEDGAGLVEEDSVEGTMRLLARFAAGELAIEKTERFRDCFQRRFEIQQAARNFLKVLV